MLFCFSFSFFIVKAFKIKLLILKLCSFLLINLLRNKNVISKSIFSKIFEKYNFKSLQKIRENIGNFINTYLLILLIIPIVDTSRIRGNQFRPLMKFFFWVFVVNFFILMWIGSQHPEYPFTVVGQISTALYFLYFLFIVPATGICENTLMDLSLKNKPLGKVI